MQPQNSSLPFHGGGYALVFIIVVIVVTVKMSWTRHAALLQLAYRTS